MRICHEEQAKQIASAKVQHPGAQEDCTVCHNPHGGESPGFLQPGPVAACLACHSDQAEEFKKKHLHQPAFDLGCATCHEPHGGGIYDSTAKRGKGRRMPRPARSTREGS